jgi:hypothetical protein
MKKIIRLTEQDLARIVKRVINESPDPKLDFILTKDEMICMKGHFKKPYTIPEYGWIKSEDGTQIQFGKIENTYLKNYCKFDINNRPINSNKEFGRFDYNDTTGVVTFGSRNSLF